MKTKLNILILILFVFPSVIFSQTFKRISLEDLWLNYSFYPERAEDIVPMNDGEHYLILLDEYTIVRYSYKSSQAVDTLVTKEMLKPVDGQTAIQIESFEINQKETALLLKTNSEAIYRHSEIASYFVFELSTKNLFAVSEGKKQRLAEFSPDGDMVAYISGNNLFCSDIRTGIELQITNDGLQNNILNGTTDWVYEEEFSFTKAWHWSPDSKKIAFIRFDESKVKEYQLIMYGDLYPEQYKYKYPKAGEDNSLVSVWICDLTEFSKPILKSIDIGNETDIYIPRICWTADPGKLAVFRMNRLQNKLDILMADATTGNTKTFYTQENKSYIEITDNFKFTENGKYFFIMSEEDGFNHVYRYDINGKLINQVTKGQWDVKEIKAIDEKNAVIYYISAESNPVNRDLYSVGFDGSNKSKIFKKEGTWEAEFSKNCAYFTGTFSDANTPPIIAIYNNKGKEIQALTDNKKLAEKANEYGFTKKEFFSFNTSGNIRLNGYIIKPPDFESKKKYPVLMNVYGGPDSQYAANEWDTFDMVWYQYLVQQGYIVVCVDGRGTGSRGEQFRKCTYMELGKLETEDQIETAKYLASQPYVDEARIGIWGWSYGGFITALCVTKGAEYFKTGIAVAPVTNWRNYDNIYTERYMRKPQDNASGYDDNSPIKYVKKLKGKLLIVHGMADDNVHAQNAIELIDALVKANKQFEMQLYPNKNHGIYGGYTRYHLYKRMSEFIFQNL
ncbi:MAG: S9 family peptidase [Bacteroidales bacterium]|jgi:dipeptidyl-peptidase-4|nr:S9 family peptidase [Bacteroidales bacterium]MDD4213796.1 S9 family peptidase [Bacteroidales bacterium]